MEEISTYRRVRLLDYMIEQRCAADHSKQIDLYAKIYCGELKAFYTPPPPVSADLDWKMNLLRNGFNQPAPTPTPTPTEIPAMERLKIKTEIGKAARGMDADRALLDSLVLEIPVDMPANNEPTTDERVYDQPNRIGTEPAAKRLSPKQEERAPIILKVIDEAGLNRYELAKPEQGKREGDRAKIWRKIPNDGMGYRDFENTWLAMLKTGTIRYKSSDSGPDGSIDTN